MNFTQRRYLTGHIREVDNINIRSVKFQSENALNTGTNQSEFSQKYN